MSIDVEAKPYPGVIQLVANSDGWKLQQTEFNLDPSRFVTGNPNIVSQTPVELVEPLQKAWLTTQKQRPTDFNGLKVAVEALIVRADGVLVTEGYLTDYFTLWGIPKAAPEEFKKHSETVVINQGRKPSAIYEASLPWGVCTHNMLLDGNGDMLMLIRSQGQGFHAGRVSVTEEEQMDPDRDISPFNAAYTSYWEELGIFVPTHTLRLLGVAMEIGAAYPAYAFISSTDEVASNIVEKWRNAQDYKENTALFAVPMTKVDEWSKEQVTSDIWNKYHLGGEISPDAVLSLHSTSPWRLELARKYTQSI